MHPADASRFLAQSQTRMSAMREGRLNGPPNPAPLFHSAADYLPDDPEHEQEVQDFYALKSSRRHFGGYNPPANATVGEEDEDEGEYSEDSTQALRQSKGKGKARHLGIHSSWRASRSAGSSLLRSTSQTSSVLSDGTERASGKGKDRMVDIGLDDSVRLEMMPEGIDTDDMVRSLEEFRSYEDHRLLAEEDRDDQDPPDDIAIEMPSEDAPPAFQQFRRPPPKVPSNLPFASPDKVDNGFMPRLSSPSQRGPHMSTVWTPSPYIGPPPLYSAAVLAGLD